ncbi:DoxX family membrane protein [bacterium]|nr:DoxX family membrane protein [bacterium]
MTSRIDRRVVALLRVGLGVLFVAAAWPKLNDPAAFAEAVSHYHLVGDTPGRVLALVLPAVELLVGIALILGVVHHGASLLVFAMMVVFTGAVGIALARGLDISCGCFDTEGGTKVGWGKIGENVALTAAAFVVWRGDRSWLSLASLRGRPTPRDAASEETRRDGSDRTAA